MTDFTFQNSNKGRNLLKVDESQNLLVKIGSPLSGFGEVLTSNLTPVIQNTFVYNINADQFSTAVAGSGTVTAANSIGTVATGTTTASTSKLFTKKIVHYYSGQAINAKLTLLFTSAANTNVYGGVGDENNGFFLGMNGTTFGILYRNNTVDTWIPRSTFNVDILDGTGPSGIILDTTKFNFFFIQIQYLGAGDIKFAFENPNYGAISVFHIIRYPNLNTTTSLRNPNLRMYLYAENLATTTNVSVNAICVAAFVEGLINRYSSNLIKSIGNMKTGFAGGNVLTIRNRSSYASLTNKNSVIMMSFSFASNGTRIGTVSVILNATLTGASFTNISTNTSVVEYDTAATLSGGIILFTYYLGTDSQINIDVSGFDVNLQPSDTLSARIVPITGTSDLAASFTWVEQQ